MSNVNLWKVKYQDYEVQNRISKYLAQKFKGNNLDPDAVETIAKLLCNRKIDTKEKLDSFFNVSLSGLSDPMLLPDMSKAVKRIKTAISNDEKITIYGDYDVDGITSVTILYQYLTSVGCHTDFYIPDRNDEGYGLNEKAICKIKENGTTLLITVDTGTTAVEELRYANAISLDVIVTDHHECRQITKSGENSCDIIPSAIAVINPKRMTNKYPFSELAGVGVVFLLIAALSGNTEDAFRLYGVYTAIGTIADIMPLSGENRIIVTNGLKMMSAYCPVSIRTLINETDTNKMITASLIAYQIAPRLNAAGRIGNPARSVEHLLCKDTRKSRITAKELCDSNKARQQLEQEILADAEKMMSQSPVSDKIIILHSDKWHHGVIGIVASRLTEKYKRPCVLLCREGGNYKGSARSVPGVNIFGLLCKVSDVLIKYGGHEMAAGLTIKQENLELFSEMLICEAENSITDKMLVPVVEAECELSFGAIDSKLMQAMKLLEPYGTSNPLPLFLIRDLKVQEVDTFGLGKHTRVFLSDSNGEGTPLVAVSFNNTNESLNCVKDDMIDLMCVITENNFNDRTYLNIQIKDINFSSEENKKLQAIRDKYQEFSESGKVTPDITLKRDDISTVYKYLKQTEAGNSGHMRIDYAARKLSSVSGRNINYAQFRLCVDVLKELNLIDSSGDDYINYKIIQKSQKTNLMLSSVWQKVSSVL